jgi:hypothetical protein
MKAVQTMLDHLWTQAHFRSDELADAKTLSPSSWNHKSVLQPILRDGHFVASSG